MQSTPYDWNCYQGIAWVQLRRKRGAIGNTFHRRSKETSPTHVLIIYSTQHCGGKCCYCFWHPRFLPISRVESCTKENAEEVGMEWSFFKCSQLHMLIALTWILLRRCDLAWNLVVFHLIIVTMGSYNMFGVCSIKSLGKPSFLQWRSAFFSFHLKLFKPNCIFEDSWTKWVDFLNMALLLFSC